MPRHQQITTCRKTGGPLSKHCTCEHCCLAVCLTCGAYEGGLTTDCPGAKIDGDKQDEIYETCLDYTDERGWHLGDPTKPRSPRFTDTQLPPTPTPIDPRTTVAPTINWTTIDRTARLQHELAQKAIAWVIADRVCDDQSASLTRTENVIADLREKQALGPHEAALAKLEHEKVEFQHACRHVEQCDEALRQTARALVAVLEET